MKPTTTALCIDDLLPLEDFVRALSRRLVRDAAAADDVVQEALLLAWKNPPRDMAALPAWLGTVVRRLASRKRQKDMARERRERAVARAESLCPSPEEVLHREEKRRLVVEQLLALPKKQREVLLLHYYEDLSPKEIAARLSRPAGTVRSQLKRGLDELRERLDRTQNGDRRSWALALIPLTIPGPGRPALVVSGGLLMGVLAMKKMILSMALLLAVVSWGMLATWTDNEGAPTLESPIGTSGAVIESDPEEEIPRGSEPLPSRSNGRQEITDYTGGSTKTGVILLELRDAQGEPAGDLAYGVIANEFGMAREGSSPDVKILEDDHLASAKRSTPQGVLRLQETRKGFLLWVQRHERLYEFFDLEKLPDDGKLRLAPERKFRVVCPGLDKEERWELWLQPALLDREDGKWILAPVFRRLAEKKGRPRYLVMGIHTTVQQGGGPVDIWVPEGQPYNIDINVDRHEVTLQGREDDVRVAPSTWFFVPGPLLPYAEVAFVDAKGRPLAPQSGMWAVKETTAGIISDSSTDRFESQNPLRIPFQAFKDNREYRIEVVTQEGDIESWDFELGEDRKDKQLRLTRTQLPERLRIEVPEPFSGSTSFGLDVETENEEISAIDLIDSVGFGSLRRRPAFIPGGKELIFLQDKKRGYKRIWLHTHDGQLAVYDPAEKGVARFRALPQGEKQQVDLRKLYKKILATGTAIFVLHVEVQRNLALIISYMSVDGKSTRSRKLFYHPIKGKKAWLKVHFFRSARGPLRIPLPLDEKYR